MISLAEDLLDISRFERGVISLRRTDVILQNLIRDMMQLQQPEADRRQITLTAQYPEHPLHIFADPDRIMQVITNLTVNAINYTAAGGLVSLQLTAEHANAVIQVQDTGIGISTEHLARVFDPFFRANEGTIRGTGLGLSISREIIELHGGKLTVESRVGVGSTFRVKLAMSDAALDKKTALTGGQLEV